MEKKGFLMPSTTPKSSTLKETLKVAEAKNMKEKKEKQRAKAF
jgi:hypothetical protein